MNPRTHAASVALVASILAGLAGCSAPLASEPEPVLATTSGEHVHPETFIKLAFPDFTPSSYPGRGGCTDKATGKRIYRFLVTNQGTLAGTIPMIKVDIHTEVPTREEGTVAYLYNVALAAGETKVLTIDIAWSPYDVPYTVTTLVDPANTVVELSKTNNELVESETFSNMYAPYACD